MENQRLSSLHEMVAKKLARVRAEKPKTSLSKSVPLEEVEALLTAERERCARAVLKYAAGFASGVRQSRADEIAAAIRSLAPQTIGDE